MFRLPDWSKLPTGAPQLLGAQDKAAPMQRRAAVTGHWLNSPRVHRTPRRLTSKYVEALAAAPCGLAPLRATHRDQVASGADFLCTSFYVHIYIYIHTYIHTYRERESITHTCMNTYILHTTCIYKCIDIYVCIYRQECTYTLHTHTYAEVLIEGFK